MKNNTNFINGVKTADFSNNTSDDLQNMYHARNLGMSYNVDPNNKWIEKAFELGLEPDVMDTWETFLERYQMQKLESDLKEKARISSIFKKTPYSIKKVADNSFIITMNGEPLHGINKKVLKGTIKHGWMKFYEEKPSTKASRHNKELEQAEIYGEIYTKPDGRRSIKLMELGSPMLDGSYELWANEVQKKGDYFGNWMVSGSLPECISQVDISDM